MAKSGIELIADKAKTLPHRSGVYRMIGADGKPLYIGKARSLQKRVKQYTNLARHNSRISKMITLTKAMEFTLTSSEAEALLLEAQMIKRNHPPFNIIFRDDKSFPLIELNENHPAARLSKYREQPGRKRKENCEYFGPFVSAHAVDRTLIALQRAFLLRSCSDSDYASRTRPCLLYQIKRCAAPCTGRIDLKAYQQLAEQARKFLQGASRSVQKELARQMQAVASDEHYELAALYRDRLAALEQIQNQSRQDLPSNSNIDLFALHRQGSTSCIQLFIIRAGQNLGNHAWFPKHHAQDDNNTILESFIVQFYDSRQAAPLILVNHSLPSADLIAEALSLKGPHKITIAQPQRGAKKTLIKNAELNARAALARRQAEMANQKDMALQLARWLDLAKTPQRIEIYDNSHIQGSQPVGAMVVAGLEGLMKAHYRIFNIKPQNFEPNDDYAMMRQVFYRRFGKKNKQMTLPDLIIVDGGKGQIRAAHDMLKPLGKHAPPILAIAKGKARTQAGQIERFFFRRNHSQIEQLKLGEHDLLLYYLQRLRDEAHRFAITRHRARRKKAALSNPLDDIVGIGAQRKKSLLRHFGSAKAAARASFDELVSVKGIHKKQAQVIYDYFNEASS